MRAPRWKGYGDSTDYVIVGAVVLAAVLLAIFAGAPSWWLALVAGIVIFALIAWYRRKPRRSYMRTNREHLHHA